MPPGFAINSKNNNIYVGGNLRLPVFKGFGLNGSATIFLAGYNIGDYEARASIAKVGTDSLNNKKSRFEVGLLLKAPSLPTCKATI